MKAVVIGTGYVGLTTAVFLTENGHQVVGLDIDEKKIVALKKGQAPFYEPGLEPLLKKGLKSSQLEFLTQYSEALKGAEVVFVCVGTPSQASGKIDLKYVKTVCRSLAKKAPQSFLVVIKSTVPPGIGEELAPLLAKAKYRLELATCPEFLREGSAIKDVFHPDRVIIGTKSQKAAALLTKIHARQKVPIHVFDINSAQLVKYSANAFLANKISFANQIANLCDQVGADAAKVMLGLGLDERIGSRFLRPGLGFGGSCFPKDTRALVYLAEEQGLNLKMVKTAIQINEEQVGVVLAKIKKLVGSLHGQKVAVLGLSFKPETDDMREARSVPLVNQLTKAGALVAVYDPVAIKVAKKVLGERVEYADSV
ncbi:UDP-glucose/GDP-mannose dehydrogenase family protein, partial [Patescibacteria group bacterium]|nr:UDP-glucose/GDP-mannose dehydrogenase family protein [Patescibacteria group bacterium]